jgi:Ca2+-binding EF-hand superfamily protein
MKLLLPAVLAAALFVPTSAFAQKPKTEAKANAGAVTRFDKLDKNHDGVISKDEWKGKPKGFDRIDANHDGVLSRDEVGTALANRKHKHV